MMVLDVRNKPNMGDVMDSVGELLKQLDDPKAIALAVAWLAGSYAAQVGMDMEELLEEVADVYGHTEYAMNNSGPIQHPLPK